MRAILRKTSENLINYAVSKSQLLVATVSDDEMLRIWGAIDGQIRLEVKLTQGKAKGVTFNGNDDAVIVQLEDGVQIVDLATGITRIFFEVPGLSTIIAAPQGRSLITQSILEPDRVRLWDTEFNCEVALLGSTSPINYITYTPDSRYLIAKSDDNIVRVWKWVGERHSLHTKTEDPPQVLLLSQGRTIFSGTKGENGIQWRLWDYDRTTKIFDIEGRRYSAYWDRKDFNSLKYVYASGDGQRLLSVLPTGRIEVRDASIGVVLLSLQSEDPKAEVADLKESGDRAVIRYGDGTVILWDMTKGVPISILPRDWTPGSARFHFGDQVRRLLITSSQFFNSLLVDMDSGDPIATIAGSDLYFALDGRHVVEEPPYHFRSNNQDKTVWDEPRVWDGQSGELLKLPHQSNEVISGVVYEASGRRMATTLQDNRVLIWNTTTGAPLVELKGHGDLVGLVFFPRGEKSIVTYSADRTVRLWNAETGMQLAVLSNSNNKHPEEPKMSPHGRWIFQPLPGVTEIWDSSTGKLRATFPSSETSHVTLDFFDDDTKVFVDINDDSRRAYLSS
jgi:WD40 repeat protein